MVAGDVPKGTLSASDAAGGGQQGEGGADADVSAPDGDASTTAPDAGDGSSPADASADAIANPVTATVSLEDGSGNAVAFGRVSALERGVTVTVTYLLTGVPGTGMAPLAFVYGPSAVANELTYAGVTLLDPLCGDGGSPAMSGTATRLVRTPSGLVSGRVVGASVPGLAGEYTATFANLPLTITTCH